MSRGSAGEYQAEEQAGVARLSWRVSGRCAMEGQSQPWTAREVLTSFLDFGKGGQGPIFRVLAGTKNEFFWQLPSFSR